MWWPDLDAPRRWWRLPGAERRVVVEAVLAIGVASVVTRLTSPGRLSLRRASAPRAGTVAPRRIAALLAATAGRLPFGSGCLPQSVALAWMLSRRGHEAALVVGVGRPDGRFAAHAWVELDGAVLVGPDTARQYAPLWRRPA